MIPLIIILCVVTAVNFAAMAYQIWEDQQ